MDNSLISVIIPVYNAECYLDRCITSVINQTYNNIEIILVNDGSKDSSLEICKKFAEKDNRIKVIDKINAGVSSARNDGIKNSIGDYIMVLDSDDWWDKDMCKIMYSNLIEKNVDCVICGAHQTSGNIWAPVKQIEYNSLNSFKCDFLYWLNTELLGPSWNKIFKRNLISDYYPEDMSFGEDLIFCLNYLKNCSSISFIKNDLYQHEVFNNVSLTHKFNIDRFNNIDTIQRTVNTFIKDFPLNDPKLYSKYVKDATLLLRRYWGQKNLTYKEKKEFLKNWLNKSYFKDIKLSEYNLGWKNNLLLRFFKNKFFIGIECIVNLKNIFLNTKI